MNQKQHIYLTALGICAACLFALAASPVSADILANDSYIVGGGDYTAGGLNGQSSASSEGFSGTWSVSSANLQVEGGGILDGDADPANGQGKFIASTAFSGFFRSARHDLQPQVDPPSNTFYMSHLVNAGSLAQGGRQDEGYAFVGFGDFTAQATIEGSANFLGGAFVGFVDSPTAPQGVDLVIRSRTGAAAGAIGDELLVADAENVTYNVVMALEYNNPGDQVRYWLNPTDFANGEAGLTASAALSGTIPGFQLGAASSMNDLSALTFAFDRSFFWDESTLATTVADLGEIPEPSTLLLAMLGLISLVRSRRRA